MRQPDRHGPPAASGCGKRLHNGALVPDGLECGFGATAGEVAHGLHRIGPTGIDGVRGPALLREGEFRMPPDRPR